jgi:tripartite-type tricarboxylate transporter receptor subunit TctC
MNKKEDRDMKIAPKAALLGAAVLIAATSHAGAAEFPQKPVELVVPFSQGGGTDRVGRIFAQFAPKHLGGEMFVSNRTGGSGAVGFSYGANARPDGHVLTMAATTITVAPHTVAGYPVSYKNFTPICLLAAIPMTLAVKSDSPYKTIDELVAAAIGKPGEMKLGAAGAATNNYLAGVAVTGAAGAKVTMIPYGGAGPALIALLGGHVDAAMADAPTTASKGWTANVASFRGIFGPTKMPDDVTDKLVSACEDTAADPEFTAEMKKFGMDVAELSGAAFGDWLKKQNDTYATAAKAAGIEPK